LYKKSKSGEWNERTVVLSGSSMYYCKPGTAPSDANVIDMRTTLVQLAPAGSRDHSFVMHTVDRVFSWATYDDIETLQWIFVMRAATTRHFVLVKDVKDIGKSVKRRGEDAPSKRDVAQRALHEILQMPGNSTCHDCNSEATNFVDLENGLVFVVVVVVGIVVWSVVTKHVFFVYCRAVLCDECASIHIQLPGGVSDLKSIAMTTWDEPMLKAFRKANKKFVNRLAEAKAGDGDAIGK
jgi:hypothetical protein